MLQQPRMPLPKFNEQFSDFDKEFEATRARIERNGAFLEKTVTTGFKVAAVVIPLIWLAGLASTAVGVYVVYHFLAKFW